jgi:multidrug resistance efflux pump
MQTGKSERFKAPAVVGYPGGTVLARIEDQSAKEILTTSLVSTLPAESMLRQQQTGRIERAGRLGGLNALQANQQSSIERELNQRKELYQRYVKLWKQGYLPGTAVLEEQSRINSLENQLLNAKSTQISTKMNRDDQIEQSKQASVSNLDSRNKLQSQLAAYLSRTTVFAPAKGIYLLSRNFFNGSFVKQGQELFVYTTTPPDLPGTIPVFLDPATAQQVVEGMSVLVTPKGISRAQYGGIPGKVVEVSKQPLDEEGLLGALQSRALVPPIQQSVPAPYLVRVQLEKSTPSECNQASSYGCYRWSSGRRPPQPVRITSLADVQITTVYLRPIEFVMPALRRAMGLVVDNT